MPGHAGLATNELADGYAKEATAEAIEQGVRPTYISIVKHRIKKSTMKKGQRAWCLQDNKRSLHTICPSILARRLNSGFSTKSQDSTLIKGHHGNNRLNQHMFRIGLSETHFCKCEDAQTAAHILVDCQLHSANREDMLNVTELSFVRHNLPYPEQSLNLSLLWLQLFITAVTSSSVRCTSFYAIQMSNFKWS